jgi:hypothetical protein
MTLIPQDKPAEDYMKMASPQESWDDPPENYMSVTFDSESMKGELVDSATFI